MDAALSKNIEVIERGALAYDHTVFFSVTGVNQWPSMGRFKVAMMNACFESIESNISVAQLVNPRYLFKLFSN